MSNTAVRYVTPAEAKAMLESGKAVLIDIREPGEHARENIPGAKSVPLSQIGSLSNGSAGSEVAIFHCEAGNRTELAKAELAGTAFNEIFVLKGGIQDWKRDGMAVNFNPKAPISILRQVQISAGSLVLLGALLATYANPNFIWLSAFVGAGLIFAGTTGTCGLARVLSVMPWNKLPA